MKKILITTMLLLTLTSFSAIAQFGIKGSLLSPGGDIVPTHKKGTAYEIYYVQNEWDGLMQSRVGFFHTTLSPALDTFFVYGVKSEISGVNTLLPGYAVYQKLRMNCIFIDQSIRIINKKGLALYAGIGIMIGSAKMKYDRYIESMIIETDGIVNPDIGGLRGNVQAAYKINSHFQVYMQAMHNAIVASDWSNSYAHNTYGIGINYFIKSDEE
ncbi:MAG: hypothetical protein H6550_14585 [Chitinophagales bacterium]|nr:hypothetical protein [Chitinophagales bacterium]